MIIWLRVNNHIYIMEFFGKTIFDVITLVVNLFYRFIPRSIKMKLNEDLMTRSPGTKIMVTDIH